jgi:hypothetical protein
MNASVEDARAQALAAAAAWWEGKPFPRDSSGDPYPCTQCRKPIEQREGTSLIGRQMLCPGCTSFSFATTTAAPGPAPVLSPEIAPWARPPVAATPEVTPEPADDTAPPQRNEPTESSRRRRRLRFMGALASVMVLVLIGGLLVWSPWKPPATPKGLTKSSSTPTTLTLKWAPKSGGSSVSQYLIFRDKKRVGSVAGSQTTYIDSNLVPGGSYQYQVVAARGSKRSAPSAMVAATTLAPSPSDLKQAAVTTGSATITWSPPADSPAPDQYVISSSGTDLATIPGAFPSSPPAYQVTGLHFSTAYDFRIQAVWLAGGSSEPSAPLTVTTPNPPVSEARLDYPSGTTVGFTVTSSHWTNLPAGTKFTNTWSFTPLCTSGPCNVTLDGNFLNNTNAEPFQLTLVRNGAGYTGQTKASLSTCNGSRVTDTVGVTITVKAAAGYYWTAAQWEGTIEVISPYARVGQRYCPAGKTVATISSATPVTS